MDNLGTHYLDNSIKHFRHLKSLGDKSFGKIEEEDFFFTPDEDTNSIAIIVRHLNGDMLSRWTDFLTSDGEKEWRNRRQEFEPLVYTSKEDIIEKWENGWERLFDVLHSLAPDDLLKSVTIKGEPHTVMEAINRQIRHYSYHTGQIIYIAKLHAGKGWESLSVPRDLR